MTINLSEQYLDILPEIKTAIDQGKPIVALESTIISHGMPYPKNVETAKEVEQMVRDNGAIPATIAILGGRLKVGLNDQELEYLGKSGLKVTKASRRDIPFIVSRGEDGATTVAATMIISDLAGISLFATGGIGGVHRDGENSMDVSADLNELSNTNVSVICAGIKSILDIGRTLEYLETMGVDYRANSANEIAASLKAKYDMGLNGGALITNPVPEKFALDPNDIEKTINEAIQEMNKRGITGKDTTPFLLARIAEQTKGESLDTNIKLVLNNAKLAAEIAAELCKL